jgi:uncharacterized protein YecE (DUF72 family)
MGKPHIGISGWTYAGWRGDFYPDGLPHKKELHYASRQLDTIEINGTFYSLGAKDTRVVAWRGAARQQTDVRACRKT